MILTTTDSVPGRVTAEILGLVEASSVVSPGLEKGISAAFSMLGGGKVSVFEDLLKQARTHARSDLEAAAAALHADAVLGFRYATSEVGQGVCEVIAYGTAVKLLKPGATL